jgi:CubicO group peptidase (beta-lactamase class C family)
MALAQAQVQSRADGPKADALGKSWGYPACVQALVRPDCRVGEWSGQGNKTSWRWIKPANEPLPLPVASNLPAITWSWGVSTRNVDDYLNEVQVTGLMVIKEGQVVTERYQYNRQPGMPMRSFSMAKTVTALLVGIAHDKGLIRSLDDKVAEYWPEVADSVYGQTTIRNLLRMASGVRFRELYNWTPDDDIYVWSQLLYHPSNFNAPHRLSEFLNSKKEREAEQGSRFKYASIETDILGRVLLRATGKNASELTQEWLWQPMGAQDQAAWIGTAIDGAAGFAGSFNASLRDYGRLGVLLANDGVRDGQTLIPKAFLMEATDPQLQPRAFQPRVATPYMGYGYQTWILPFKTRTFALQGIHGQTIFVQPSSKIVMVQTAAFDKASGAQDNRPYQFRGAFWEGVLKSLGGAVD